MRTESGGGGRGALLGLIVIAAILAATQSAAAQGEKPTCYKLIKADIVGVHGNDGTPNERAEDQDWANQHEVTTEPDGTIIVKHKNKPTHTWRINPKTGHAIATETNNNSSVEVNWSVPPEHWCSNQDVRMSLGAKASGEIFGKALFWQKAAGRWEQTPGSAVEGTNPFGGIAVGRFSSGYGESGSGSMSIRPLYKGGDEFISFNVGLAANDWLDVHYHFQRTDEPSPPKQECPKTFERDWATTTWGKFVMKVSGTSMSGEYANRDGKFGPGTVTGTVSGDKFEGTWKDANGEGTISLTLSADGCSWAGSHTVKPGTTTAAGPTAKPNPGGGGGTGGAGTTPGGPTGPAGTGEPGGTLIPGPLGPSLELPADPCMDPAAQQCIEEWIQLATRLRNKYDKSPTGPNGPWRNNEYGIWVGRAVKSGGKHDNWETVYRSNKYCYIWLEYQKEHEFDKYYNDELPMLKLFVEDCLLKKKLAEPKPPGTGGPGTGTPGAGTGTPGTVTPGTGTAGSGSGAPTPPTYTAMTLEAHKRTVKPGDLVLVPVWLHNAADIGNINYTVAYDASAAKAEGDPTSGYLIDKALFSGNPAEPGLVSLGFARKEGIGGSGPVAHVPFRAVGKAGDKTALTLAVSTINTPAGAIPAIALVHGEILIEKPGGGVLGDCDGDGVLNEADAWCALRMSVKLLPENLNVDIDRDGQVTSRDAGLILLSSVR